MNTEERIPTEQGDTGEGKLIVHVTTARGSIPLEGAQVSVLRDSALENTPPGEVIATLTSDRDGNTPILSLPAPPRAESLRPSNGAPPFATYHIAVRLEGYFDQDYIQVPIFDGIVAVQPADMIPLPENGRTDSRTPDGTRFFESSAPEL